MLTVLTPAASHRLTTLTRVLQALGIESSNADLLIDQAIDQASDTVRAWCGRTFALESVRETLTCTGNGLMLSRWPVVSVQAATACGTIIDPAFTHADDAGFLYRLNADGDSLGWPGGRIVVDYTAGYVLPSDEVSAPTSTLPGDIERAAILLVRDAYYEGDRDPFLRSESVEGVMSRTFGTAGGSGDMEGLLAPYRVVGVA